MILLNAAGRISDFRFRRQYLRQYGSTPVPFAFDFDFKLNMYMYMYMSPGGVCSLHGMEDTYRLNMSVFMYYQGEQEKKKN
jgi:hypothetical protein